MRISDWSSDVCSSDLQPAEIVDGEAVLIDRHMMLYDGVAYSRDDIHHYGLKLFGLHRHLPLRSVVQFGKSRAKMIYAPILIMPLLDTNIVCHRSASDRAQETMQIGRASCRERVCQYV